MKDLLKKICAALGINRAIGYGVLSRVWAVSAGVVTLLLIAVRFSREQQGFYFTIGSLLALQIFFELGLTVVISQFASHEFSKTWWLPGGEIEGDTVAVGRIHSLLATSFKWFFAAALILTGVLIPLGLVFFSNGVEAAQLFDWRLPWILAVLGTAVNLLAIPFFAVIMGSGDMVAINSRQLLGSVTGSVLAWAVIGLGGGLYALPCVSFGAGLVSWGYLIRNKPGLLAAAWRYSFAADYRMKVTAPIDWRTEVWPMQWRIAISWMSGYFIFQLFTPVLFHYQGAVVAGQMGMTLSAANALLGVCITWMTVRNPEFGKLIAAKEWGSLDALFFQVLKQSILIAASGAALGGGAIFLLKEFTRLGERFLPLPQVLLLLAATVAVVTVNAYATYLRAHKKEPLLAQSVATAVLQGFATWFLGKEFSSFGVSIGYFIISVFISLPTVYWIWRHYRNAWHGV